MSTRITPAEIAKDLGIGKGKVYELLESRASNRIRGVRVGHPWIIMRDPYAHWKQTFGADAALLHDDVPVSNVGLLRQ